MAKYTPLAVILFCAWASARANDRIPISAVPSPVRAAIQYYAPGAQLTEARVTQDRTYRRAYDCTYFRNIHLGSIKLNAHGQLLDLDETLVVEDVPPAVRRTIQAETKGGLIRKIKLTAEYGRAIYRVKAFYGKSTDIEVSLAITRSGRVVERKVSRGLLIFFTAPLLQVKQGRAAI
jgi:hypothetical protein